MQVAGGSGLLNRVKSGIELKSCLARWRAFEMTVNAVLDSDCFVCSVRIWCVNVKERRLYDTIVLVRIASSQGIEFA